MRELVINFRIIFTVGLSVLLGVPQFSYAESILHGAKEEGAHVHGVHQECRLPKSGMDIVSCALSFHPSIKRGGLEVESVGKLEGQANQVPNPVLSVRYIKGDNEGREGSELEGNLSFTLELGNKREARKEFAQARKSEAVATYDATRANVKIDTILNLYRLRQVLDEKELLGEAISAFAKVIGQLKSLPRLSPEQEASLTLFQIALEETRVNESEVFEEERKLEHFFHIATGHSIEEIKGFLPDTPRIWPNVQTVEIENTSPEVKKIKSLAELASKELEIQKSEAWPNLNIGPSVAIERDGNIENKMVGFNVQIPLPLFQVNGGGKAYARSELLRAQKNISLTLAEENHERFEQLKIYESAVSILNRTMKLNVVGKKHNRIEKLYLRGVVSSSVFLDSLKQKFSYLKSRNNREITALRALWNIYKYDGKIFEEKL